MDDATARELLRRARGLDDEALEWLYRSYADRVFRYIRAKVANDGLAEEVTADVFLRLLRALETYRLPETDVLPRFTAWLYRVAHNHLVDMLRRWQREEEAREEASRAPAVSVSSALEEGLLREELREAVAALTEEQRRVVVLRFYEELTLAEAAEVMDRSVEAIKGLQKRALASLARQLDAPRARERRERRGRG